MNFLPNYEGPLRSYIQERIALLANALEEEVRNRDNVDIALLEQQLDRESDQFLIGLTRRIHQIRDEIKTHRPTNIQSDDYELRMIQYRQLIQSSSISFNRLTDSIDFIFDQIQSIVKNILQWIKDNSRTVIDILEQICHAFRFIETFFH